MYQEIWAMMERAVEDGVCPSAALAIGRSSGLLASGCFGKLDEEGHCPDETTLYDLASLTKVTATTMIALRLVEQGVIRLADRVGDFFPGTLVDKREITLGQLLTHTGGFPAHFFLWDEASSGARGAEAILAHPLAAAPGSTVIYSCMGFILLGKILEKAAGMPLDQLAAHLVFEPLGMQDTGFCPNGANLAPTERNPASGQWLRGQVHDENARFMDGVAGNAGLFSSLRDMSRFGQMLAGGGSLEGRRFLSPALFRAMLRCRTEGMNQRRALGFQLSGQDAAFMGDLVSPLAFGHTGFTGTSLLVEPEQDLYVVLLTNRVHPTRENQRLLRFRSLLHNRILATEEGA